MSADEEEVRVYRCVSCFLPGFSFLFHFIFRTPRGEAVQGRPFEQLVCLVCSSYLSLSHFSVCVCVNQLLHHTQTALSSMILDG